MAIGDSVVPVDDSVLGRAVQVCLLSTDSVMAVIRAARYSSC